MLSIIVAVAENLAIGKDNQLLWHLSEDLKRFKKLTSGKTIVMGKNTYFSLPKRPLPNRRHVVLTDVHGEKIDDCVMAYSLEDAFKKLDPEQENFIIGGASIYRQFLDRADRLYITWVHARFEADAFFPELELSQWDVLSEEHHAETDEKNPFPYTYTVYSRKKA
jgi:dihydrofolate reductase